MDLKFATFLVAEDQELCSMQHVPPRRVMRYAQLLSTYKLYMHICYVCKNSLFHNMLFLALRGKI